tara:strand:- start:7417 stop:8412 length:996 start_codon:yes stop_codon:yes gene_type:complete
MAVNNIHPISAISSCVNLYKNNGTDKITLQTDFEDFEYIMENLDLKMKEFNLLTGAAIEPAADSEKKTLNEIKARGLKEIALSYLSQDFAKRHNTELRKLTGEKLISFIKEVIGTQSADQKADQAQKQLLETDRRDNEKFELYLNRLTAIAGSISENTEVQQFLTTQQFKTSLSPQNKQFLVEQGKNSGSMFEISKFLDEKQKYRKMVSLNSVDSDQFKNISQQNKQLQAQIQLLTELLQNKTTETDEELSKLKKSINKIQKSKKSESNLGDTSGVSGESTKKAKKISNDDFCQKCGMYNHTTDECRGCRMTCNTCHQVGHLSKVCPQAKN